MIKYICSKNVLIGADFVEASIGIKEGKIVEVKEFGYGDSYGDNYIIPGLIEIHTHGGLGFEVMDGTEKQYKKWLEFLPSTGVTSLLVSPYTASIDNMRECVSLLSNTNTDKVGSEVLGLHLEGPFLSRDHAGAMDTNYIIKPSIEIFNEIARDNDDSVKLVTLAPELDTNYELTQYLASRNISVSAGHTALTYEDSIVASNLGLKSFTHTFNGMKGFHHRNIGTVGAAFLNDKLYTEVIVDGIHASFDAVKTLFKIKPKNKLIIITDSISVMGLEDGIYLLNGSTIEYKNNKAYLVGTEQLAGSTIRLIDCVKNAHLECDLDIISSVNAATINPATLIGVNDRKGSIEIGKDADFCVIDKEVNLLATYCNGLLKYLKDS